MASVGHEIGISESELRSWQEEDAMEPDLDLISERVMGFLDSYAIQTPSTVAALLKCDL